MARFLKEERALSLLIALLGSPRELSLIPVDRLATNG
jgi:hypothetical protein